jgi:GST-like protein
MIDLYTTATANGQKVSIMLEECGLPYRAEIVDLSAGHHLMPPFIHLNPAGKVPAIVDSEGPGGEPFALAQSLAICLYLAEKAGRFLPADGFARAEAYRYMALVSSDIGGAFTGLFVFSMIYPQQSDAVLAYFREQAARNLRVLDRRLGESPFLAGDDYSIADILAYPVAATSVRNLPEALSPYPNLRRWAEEIGERPAVRRGMMVGAAAAA